MLVAAGGPNDPTYWDDAAKMSELMLKMGAETKWEPAEKHCRRGDFPSVAYGWSYGKGQPMPQQLGGKHQEMMADFISQPCVQRIASYQSGKHPNCLCQPTALNNSPCSRLFALVSQGIWRILSAEYPTQGENP